jgi:hypothetical protein
MTFINYFKNTNIFQTDNEQIKIKFIFLLENYLVDIKIHAIFAPLKMNKTPF